VLAGRIQLRCGAARTSRPARLDHTAVFREVQKVDPHLPKAPPRPGRNLPQMWPLAIDARTGGELFGHTADRP
jgi:hypothetical protein